MNKLESVVNVVNSSVKLNFQVAAQRWQTQTEAQLSPIVASQQQGLGHLEESLLKNTQELQRQALEQATQAKAEATPPHCPCCGQPLSRLAEGHERTVETRFGPIPVKRTHGYCKKWRQWFYPADLVLGLNPHASASPSVQEMAALVVSKMPVAEASKVMERLTGRKLSPATLDREARRQGQKARDKRQAMDALVEDLPGYQQVTRAAKEQVPQRPFTLVMEIDAWNIRERDAWGQTQALRDRGEEPQRWHWVYGATCFCLANRLEKGDRAMITQRGYVMTRLGTEALGQQLRAEALRQGLSQADRVLVIADGALWIWNLADNYFPEAQQRLDFYHAASHLWAVANELHGKGTPQARAWAQPLLTQLKQGESVPVLQTIEEALRGLTGKPAEAVQKNKDYLAGHQKRLDYLQAQQRGEPLGSGAMESTCRQYQCRFKRPGQFWTLEGDEGLMTLETFWRNNRWHHLFPHVDPAELAKN